MSSRASDPIGKAPSQSSGPDRRAHPRLPLHKPALLGLDDSGLRACIIRSYSAGGLFLEVDRIRSDPLMTQGRPLAGDDRITIRYSIDMSGTAMEFETQARVARMSGEGIGVAFTEPDSPAAQALKDLALVYQENLARQRPRGVQSADAGGSRHRDEHNRHGPELFAACRDTTETFLDEHLPAVFDQAKEALFAGASEGASDAEQMECFDATQEIENLREVVTGTFRTGVLKQLDDLWNGEFSAGAGDSEASEGELSLVDTCGFDDWLLVTAIVSRSQAALEEGQQSLGRRLGKLFAVKIDNDSNPFGLQRMSHAFHDAVQNLGAVKRTRRALFEALGHSFVAALRGLHATLNTTLEQGGVHDDAPPSRTPAGRRGARREHPSQVAQPPAEDASSGPSDSAEADAPAIASPPGAPAPSSTVAPVACAIPEAPVGRTGPQFAHALRTAADMMKLGRSAHPEGDKGHARNSAMARRLLEASDTEDAPPQSLDGALAALQVEGAQSWGETGPLALGERLRVGLLGEGVELDSSTTEVADVISRLMDAILDDPLIHPEMKTRIRQLAVPLVRIALVDDSFYTSESHVAREVINALGELEPNREHGSQELLSSSVDPLIERTLGHAPVSSEALTQACRALQALVQGQGTERADKVAGLVLARKVQLEAVMALRGDAGAQAGTTGTTETTSAVRAQSDTWRKLLDRVNRLTEGDVVVRDAGTAKARAAVLAWVADDHQTFLLVNRAGEEAEYLTRQEMAMGLHRGSLRADASAKLPVVERNIYRMLNSLHDKLERDAVHDPSTGLLNRKQLDSRLKTAVDEAGHVESILCVLGIDEFDAIVARCGRVAGDTLMHKLARVLEKQVGESAMVSRADGQRFAILIRGCDRDEVVQLVERQRRSVDQSLCYHNGNSFKFSLSFGLAAISDVSRSPEALLKAAAGALADARKAGGNRLHWHSPAAGEQGRPRAGAGARPTVLELIERNGLGLRCQRVEPIATETGALPYYEILLGVKGAKGRLNPPGKVISDAESQGHIETLDRWVIRQVLTWMAEDSARLANVSGYAINLSGITLSEERLLGYVLEQITESGVPPGKLIFEVTETAGIDSLSVARHFVTTLRDNGCRFSLDDFGAGHGSLAYLKQLPFDNVKIDGLFVKDMMTNETDHAMVKSINDIAHFMGRHTVAEFVEDEAILGGLRELGVDYAQGYGVERPIPVVELAKRWQESTAPVD